jgi:tellurite resistance protein TerC
MQLQRRETVTMRVDPGAQPPTATARGLRKVAIAVAGFGVLLFGVMLLVVPVPGTSVVVIPLGLAILAREFAWAQRLLDWLTASARRIWAGVRRLFGRRPVLPAPLPSV